MLSTAELCSGWTTFRPEWPKDPLDLCTLDNLYLWVCLFVRSFEFHWRWIIYWNTTSCCFVCSVWTSCELQIISWFRVGHLLTSLFKLDRYSIVPLVWLIHSRSRHATSGAERLCKKGRVNNPPECTYVTPPFITDSRYPSALISGCLYNNSLRILNYLQPFVTWCGHCGVSIAKSCPACVSYNLANTLMRRYFRNKIYACLRIGMHTVHPD